MYTKEEREGILWEFHRSGLSAPRRLQEPAAFPEQGQPVCLAQAGGGGRADRLRDARPDGAHALLARRGWIGNTYLDDFGRDSPASLNSTGDI